MGCVRTGSVEEAGWTDLRRIDTYLGAVGLIIAIIRIVHSVTAKTDIGFTVQCSHNIQEN